MLPGQLYADYDWGGTVDPVLPALADRPVAVRYAVPVRRPARGRPALDGRRARAAAARAAGPAAAAAGPAVARAPWSPAPTTTARAAAPSTAADAADVLDQLGAPDARWGPVRARAARGGHARRRARRCRACGPGTAPGARPIVRLEADAGATVVDGGADALAGLAAFGALPDAGRIAYAGDRPRASCARRRGGEVVISDSNRRRVFAAARMAQNHGWTLAADDPFSPDAAMLDPFPGRGTDAQTVARTTARAPAAPFSPAYSQFPEQRPFAAFDGDTATALAGRPRARGGAPLARDRLRAPRDVDVDRAAAVRDRRGEGHRGRGRRPHVGVRPGWNRLQLGLKACARCACGSRAWSRPKASPAAPAGSASCASPACACARRCARPCWPSARSPAATSAHRPTYLFERTAGDDPFRRDPRRGTAGAELVRDRQDGERGLERRSRRPPRAAGPPTAGDGRAAGATTRDRRAGGRRVGRLRVLGPVRGAAGVPGVERVRLLATPVDRLLARRAHRLARVDGAAARDGAGAAARAARARPCGARRWCGSPRTAAEPAGRGRARRPGRAARAAARADVPPGDPARRVPRGRVGRRAPAPRGRHPRDHGRRRPDRATCGATGASRAAAATSTGTLGSAPLRMRADASVADLDAGRPLRMRACGAVDAPAGPQRLSIPPATFAPYLVRLRSPAPDPPVRAAAQPGRVLDRGDPGRDARTGVRLDVDGPPGSCSASPTTTPGARSATAATWGRRSRWTATRWRGRCRGLRARGDGVRARRARARRLPLLAAVPAGDARARDRAPPARAGAAARRAAGAVGRAPAGGARRRCWRCSPAPSSASCSPPAPRR